MSRVYPAATMVLGLALLAACTDQRTPLEPTSRPTRAQPLVVSVPGAFSQLASGNFHTCAVRIDGAVECWGYNVVGQAPPTPKVAAVGTFTAVSAASLHTCALRTDGVVECWGLGFYGEAPATKTAAVGRFTAVASADFHTCGVRSDGAVECWGRNDDGQAPPTPKVAAINQFTAAAGGEAHTCALRTDGAIECWGNNGAGQAPSTKVAEKGKFTALDAATKQTCALRDDGAVECWGDNGYGNAPPTKVAAVGTFTAVTVAGMHTCALRSDGAVECWGNNQSGQAPATKVAAAGRYAAVAGGLLHTCALRTDGVAECWGENNSGQAPATRTSSPIETHINPTATFTAPASVIVGQSIALGLTNPAVPGHPEATAFTYAFDCGAGYTAATGIAAAQCASGTAGQRTVKGKVIDKDGDVGEYTKTVTVLSTSDAIAQLKAAVGTASGVSSTLRNPLIAKLDAALAALTKQKFETACTALTDFRSQVTEKRGKGIPVATADGWLAAAADIKTAIGCSGGC